MPPAPVSNYKNQVMLGFAFLAIFIMAAAFYYFQSITVAPAPEVTATSVSEESLGGGLYQQTQNPLGDKLPQEESLVANPINDAYKNPFE